MSSIPDFEKNEFSLQRVIYEISSSLRHLEKHCEENQHTLSALAVSKAEHNVEIKHLSAGMERILNDIKQIDTRMARVETILESRQPEEKISRGVALRLITCGLSYFFGIKVKD